ncbi:MAG: ATP-binding protein [Gemmatimonadota bacterium]
MKVKFQIMTINDQSILELNPWWANPSEIQRDPYLVELERLPLRWDPPVLEAVETGTRRVHTLRGPRQVGKSTTMKLLVRRLLEAGERRVLYYTFDLSRDNRDIGDVIRRARALHPDPNGPWFLFLDEVTTIDNWQLGVKYVIDNGPARDDFFLCTGSSAREVSGELLPGRRGKGRDYLQLPISFRDFCMAAMGIELPEETITASKIPTEDGYRLIRTLHLLRQELDRAWRAYLQVGGFPAAVTDYLKHGAISPETVQMLWNIVASDIRRAGRDDIAGLKLIERVGRSLGTPLAWKSLAGDMDVSHPTAREYVQLLSESFLLLVFFFWDLSKSELSARKQRKVYFVDPLMDAIPETMMSGVRRATSDALRENLVGVALFRSATDRLVQSDPVAGSVGYWKSQRGHEIDFLLPSVENDPGSPRFPIEVKGDDRRSIASARTSIGRVFGRGLIVTRSFFDLDDDIPAIPEAVFLAGLPEHPLRTPVGR